MCSVCSQAAPINLPMGYDESSLANQDNLLSFTYFSVTLGALITFTILLAFANNENNVEDSSIVAIM